MKKYLVKVYSWENPLICDCDASLDVGERIVVRKDDFGSELGEVKDIAKDKKDSEVIFIRRGSERDIENFESNKEKKDELLKIAKEEAKRLGLEMKLIDCRINLEGSNAIIAFTADERVDFRELVKNLSRIFRRGVRMHQVGSRDEARSLGGSGVCGRSFCCLRFSGNLPSISIDMARVQQIAHRGSERISGVCGRLMCCLSYESEQYKELMEGMPEMHSIVRTPDGKGEVIEINPMTQEIKIKDEEGKIGIFSKEDIK